MNEKDFRWNKFTEEVCYQGLITLSDIQRKAAMEGKEDDWVETDNAYYEFSPSLCDCFQEYVENNKAVIFD